MLRPLVLTGDDDAGRQMGKAHGRVGLVDVLTAGAAGAEGIDSEIDGIDYDLDLVVDRRENEDRSERSVAARVSVERRDAHQPVNASFGLEITVGVVAL